VLIAGLIATRMALVATDTLALGDLAAWRAAMERLERVIRLHGGVLMGDAS
jgi:hypothetical protein